MSLKYELLEGQVKVKKDGSDEGYVRFNMTDDAGVGKLGKTFEDEVRWPITTWPASKAALKTQAENAITDEYPGATSV